ncbi:MAG: hypothetical protein ACYTHM_11160 [Planctomycetota bacterium]|jgi:hypothetical protein
MPSKGNWVVVSYDDRGNLKQEGKAWIRKKEALAYIRKKEKSGRKKSPPLLVVSASALLPWRMISVGPTGEIWGQMMFSKRSTAEKALNSKEVRAFFHKKGTPAILHMAELE